jgi:Tol biopolymer transport system component/DNA-binding winged helix-turn-helix (wHTH) protein
MDFKFSLSADFGGGKLCRTSRSDVVSSPHPADPTIRFGEFSADLPAAELYRNATKVKLQGQPFEVLAMLLERPGRMVTREELHHRLWPSETFVDFEHGLNAAVNRLREALGDSTDAPRFVATIPRRGYKFIAHVDEPPALDVTSASHAHPEGRRLRRVIGTAILVVLIAAAISGWLLSKRLPRITASTRLTFSGLVSGHSSAVVAEEFPALVTDGNRIYFAVENNGTPGLAYISAAGGGEVFMSLPFEGPEPRHISPDGSTLLVSGNIRGEAESHLWFVPTAGGGPRRLDNIDGQDGAWSPDGHRFVYANGKGLYLAESDGRNGHNLTTTSGKPFWIRWSPDGTRLRYTSVDPTTSAQTLWECLADGAGLHRLPISWDKQPQECCGEWTADGRYFLFRTLRDNQADIWLIRENRLSRGEYTPVQLTTGPLDTVGAIPSRNSKQLFVIGEQPKTALLKYDLKTHQLAPYLAGTSAFLTSASSDGQWIAYVEHRGKETVLWRSKPDGSDRLQLTTSPMLAGWSQWSPDGKQIAFMAKMPDSRWNIYVVPANGGNPRAMLPKEQNAVDPEWSPDGRLLMFGLPPRYMAEASAVRAIYTLKLDSGQVSIVPGSEGLYSPHWSPNGRYVVAMPLSEDKLMLFDFATQRWTKLIDSPLGIGTPRWSQDSEYVYFDRHIRDALVRVARSSHKLERVLDLKSANPNSSECDFDNMTPDGAPLISCWLDGGDIYALDLELP